MTTAASNFSGFDLNNFNDFLQQAQNTIVCDSACQQQKESQQLEQDYLNAQTNLKTAQYQVDTTQQNYITFTQGPAGYTQFENNKFNTKAQDIVTKFTDNFNNEVKEIKNKITTYSGLLNNYKNVYELYLKYVDEKKILQKDYKTNTSDVVTNDRKTYYENQEVDFLDYIYKYFLRIIYLIVVVVFFISVFIYPSPFTWKSKFGILIFLIILPFISTWLLSHIIQIIYKIYDLLPKNVYPTL
jgi:hypothetical protein